MCSSVLLRTEESNLSYTSQPIYMDSSVLGVKNKREKHKVGQIQKHYCSHDEKSKYGIKERT